MEQGARFEEIRVRLAEPLDGAEAITAVLGIPEWWPAGARVAVAIAHDRDGDRNDPLVERIAADLTARRHLTLRFDFPFAEVRSQQQSQASGRRTRKRRGRPPLDVDVLQRAYRAALGVLGRDPSAAPAHLFVGGVGVGGVAAAALASARLPISGVFCLSYPLLGESGSEEPWSEALYRISASMLFVQGAEDPACPLAALRRVLARVGAPTTLRIIDGAGASLIAPTASGDDATLSRRAVAATLGEWIDKVVGEGVR